MSRRRERIVERSRQREDVRDSSEYGQVESDNDVHLADTANALSAWQSSAFTEEGSDDS